LGLAEEEKAVLLAAVPKRAAPRAPLPESSTPPVPLTPLVGREQDTEEVAHLLQQPEVRLLTLTGPGGVGKTRLALRVAWDGARSFPDGVAFVDLTELADPTRFALTISYALGLRDAGTKPPFDLLLEHLREKELLLVLDNFERVTTAALLLVKLLSGCPRLKALVTSRIALGVHSEQRFAVQPLQIPTAAWEPDTAAIENSPAVVLFVGRARAVDPAFRLTDDNAPAVAGICRRLDGLPLAIELAASRAVLLPPEALLARLESGLSLLEGGGPDLPERQRTMRRTIAWSHELLSEAEKTLFRRLSIFEAGCTLEAAEAVCFKVQAAHVEAEERLNVLDGLSSLVDASLLRREPGPDGEPRLTMLALVREHAQELLVESGEADATRERHAGYFVTLAETAEPALYGPDHVAWLERLEREHDNLRAALEWARKVGDTETGLRLTGALSWFWWVRGHLGEGRRWIEGLLEQDAANEDVSARGSVRAKALLGAGRLAFGQGDLARAARMFGESLSVYRGLGDEGGTASVLVELGQVTHAQGDQDRAAVLSEQGLALSRELGNHMNAAIALNTLGHIERHRRNREIASARYEESVALFRRIGDQRGAAYALAGLGTAALEGGEHERALTLHGESLSLYERMEDKAGVALALVNLGDVTRERGDEERAAVLYEEALALQRELGNERGAARALARLTKIR
jgi:predicted ATPase